MKSTIDRKGFTIIEVLIVLAIAGLIMVIVFLAVPALQRNSRNNARHKEATRIAAAVNECMAQRYRVPDACDEESELGIGELYQLVNISRANSPQYREDGARIYFRSECNSGGTAANADPDNPLSFTITYRLEPNNNRCVSSVF